MLLGGNSRDRVRVYAGVYTAPDPGAARDEFDRLNADWGLTAFKLSPYRIDIHANRWGEVVRTSAEYFRSLRETVRADYEIAFDAHARIFEPQQAVQFGNALAPYDPLFFEEPIRPENIEAWGAMKRQMACTLATGESLYSRFEFLRLLSVGGADIIQPDICVVGGLLEMRKIAAIAEAHYVTVAPHNPMGPLATAVNLHFSAAQPNFRILEYRLPVGQAYGFRRWRQRGRGRPDTRRALREGPVPAQGRLSGTQARSAGLGRRDGHGRACQGRLRPLGAQGSAPPGRLQRLRLKRSWRRGCQPPRDRSEAACCGIST